MKKIGKFSLALTYAGCFLGAGYLSGKELWQYFGTYGESGFLGLALAMSMQLFFGVLLLKLASETNMVELDKLIIRWNIPFLRNVVSAVSLFFMFGVFVIMSAGAGALIERVTGLPYWICCAIFIIIIALMSSFGVSGMIKIFSYIVPLLTAACIVICTIQLLGGKPLIMADGQSNPLLGGWAFSSVNYIAYNLFGTVGILAPVAVRLKSKNTLRAGVALGVLILIIIALPIILALCTIHESALAELPMLEVSYAIAPTAGIIYALLLFLGMAGTSVSSLVACAEFAEQHSSFFKKYRLPLVYALSFLAFIGSLVGFGELVGTVYPICGYMGIIALILLTEHYIHVKIKQKKAAADK